MRQLSVGLIIVGVAQIYGQENTKNQNTNVWLQKMDFSHIVQFPTADSHESHHLLEIDPKWHSVLYNQADKLRQLQKLNTKEIVYVIGREIGSHPISKDDDIDIAEGTWDGLYSEDIIKIAQDIPIIIITSSANCKEEWDKVCSKLGVANPCLLYTSPSPRDS